MKWNSPDAAARPCLMLILPHQPNAIICFLTGTSFPPKSNAHCLPWGSSLSLCPSTHSNPLSPLICKVQSSTSTPQPSSCYISFTPHSYLAGRLRAWFWTLEPPWFGVSFHLLKSLDCLSRKCWTESLPFPGRSWPYVLFQIFFLEKNGFLGVADRLTATDPVFFITLTVQSRRHAAEPFATQKFSGCIHTNSLSRASSGPHAWFPLVKFLWSVAVSYIHVKMSQFSIEKRGYALRSVLHPASVGSISVIMEEQHFYIWTGRRENL